MEVYRFKNRIGDLLRDISGNMEGAFKPICDHYGLTMMQLQVLMKIYQVPEITVGKLGKSIRVIGCNMSSMCKRLEKEGFLKRDRNPDDERVVTVMLTEKGRNTVCGFNSMIEEKYANILKSRNPEDFMVMEEGLEKLNALLMEMKNTKMT